MILEEIKGKVEQLTAEERRELLIFLNQIHLQSDEEFWMKVRARMEDKDKSHWVNIDDIK